MNGHLLEMICDACPRAYGGCVYVKVIANDGKITFSLFAAKSRVAPVKELTIPKLELMGALLLIELVDRVCAEFRGLCEG